MPVDTGSETRTAEDRKWFTDQVDDLLPNLYGRALRLCGDVTDAEDLVAIAVAKGWEALPSLRDRSALGGWLFRILNNAFVSHCRSARAAVEHESFEESMEAGFSLFEQLHQPILMWWSNPETDFLNRLLREDFERAVDGLTPEFRAVLVMVDVQGMTYREVSEILGIPIGTVRSRLARGRNRLQEALWEHAVDAGLKQPDTRTDDAAADPEDGSG